MNSPTGPPPGTIADRAEGHALLIVIVPSGTLFEGVIRALRATGFSGTVIDGKGLTAVMREEMPIFGGLAAMLPNSAGSRVVLIATTHTGAREAMAMFQTEFKPADRPIAMVIGLSDAMGIRT